MDYEILPLAVTKVEWSTFVNVCQRIIGVSPTRGLDACHLDIKDPAAYLGCLDMSNSPLESLRDGGSSFDHFTISFAMVLDVMGIVQLMNTPLKYSHREGRKPGQYLVIVSGTMDEWVRAVLRGCLNRADYELRFIMNSVLIRFQQAGFREVFTRYQKQYLPDGTFVLKT